MTAGAPASTAASNGLRSRSAQLPQRRAQDGQRLVAVGGHPAVAGEVLGRRHHAGVVVALDGGRDGARGERRVAGGRPGPDRRVGSADRDVGDGGEDPGEAEVAQLQRGGTGGLGHDLLTGLPLCDGRAGGRERGELGGDSPQVRDHATLLVDADDRRPVAAVGGVRPGHRGGRGADLGVVGHVGRGDADAGEVVLPDHGGGDGRVGAGVPSDDHLPRELLGRHPRDQLLRLRDLTDRRSPGGGLVGVLGRLRGRRAEPRSARRRAVGGVAG